ncbi:hypothetical protein GGR56DRAFT_196655 [Xylariaceae sp. FL0804]|nr:hypothetical protein GGR56DRAFT_196655 [Xylariaceae sp. FL0804]
MANLICQKEWGRDLDQDKDKLTSSGLYDADGIKCYFVLDNGVRDGEAPYFKMYRWDGRSLNLRNPHAAVINYVEMMMEKKAGASSFTDAQYLDKFGREEFDQMISQREEQRARRNGPSRTGGTDTC